MNVAAAHVDTEYGIARIGKRVLRDQIRKIGAVKVTNRKINNKNKNNGTDFVIILYP